MKIGFNIEAIKDDKVLIVIESKNSVYSLGEFDLEKVLDVIDSWFVELEELKKKVKKFIEERSFDPGRYWDKLKNLQSIEEIAESFNSLSEDRRKKLAEYVLTRVNIFKGAGALFVKHYDPGSAKLFL